MKTYVYTIISVLFMLSSCTKEDAGLFKVSSNDDAIKISNSGKKAEVNIGHKGGNVFFFVDSSSEWIVDEPSKEWCLVEYTSKSLVILVDQFLSEEKSRSISISLHSKEGLSASVIVKQTSSEPTYLNLSQESGIISSRGGEIEIETNRPESIKFEVIEALVNFLTFDYDKENNSFNISAEKNITGVNLEAIINLSAGEGLNKVLKTYTVKQNNGKLVLKYKTKKEGTVIAIPLYGLVDITVDWGDKSSDAYKTQISAELNNDYITHWYKGAGEYSVTISGNVEKIYCNELERCTEYLTEIVQWGDNNIQSLEKAFYGTNIVNVPSPDIYSFEKLVNVKSAFENCTKLETVSTDIFSSALNISDFTSLFKSCTLLKSESPYSLVNEKKIHLYERASNEIFLSPENSSEAFKDCSILSDYGSIPNEWK